VEKAGDRTLAERLRGDDMPSLDLMRRFGEDLLQVLNHLEEQGVAHRDIKPDNIGIAPAGGSGRLRLVLFDFSLTRTPPENIQAGTRPYLDPFLALRPQRRWVLHAERYAAAVTLHELVAGVPPTWGDGATEPLVTEDEATIATDRFDPTLREGLRDFFTQALRRNAEERFDNAEEMLRDWRRAFEPLDRGAIAEDSIETIARRLDRRSTIAELGYSVEARDVLDRMGVHTVQQLLAVDRIRFRYLRSVSDKIRREIRERAKRLAEIRPELKPGGGSEDAQAWASVDRLAELLIPRRPAGDETAEDRLLELYLGLEPADGPASWPAAGDVAREAGVARSAVAAVLGKARDRWHKSKELNELRTELAALLSSAGGVATADELAALLLAARGSVEDSENDRGRLASAVLRAAIELEASASDTVRFASYADNAPILVALTPELAAYAVALGAAAERMAREDPLPAPGRVEEELNLVALPNGSALPPGRSLRLAAAASSAASVSARAELYPKGMAPAMALRLSLGSLAGPRLLTEETVRERVRGRFPDATPLPPRPELDLLLDEVGAERIWSDDDPDARGYVSSIVTPSDRGSPTGVLRYGLAISEALVKSDPNNASWKLDLSVTYNSIGDINFTQGALAQALESYRAAFDIRRDLVKFDPNNLEWQSYLSTSYNEVGDVEVEQGDLAHALESYQGALDIRLRLAKFDPSNLNWQADLSRSYNEVGDVEVKQDDLAHAVESYLAALDIRQRLAKSDPSNQNWQQGLSISFIKIGDIESIHDNLIAALGFYRMALEIRQGLAKVDPHNAEWQHDLA
jgi:tetratricopeptide (TPR) repeat protein